MECEVFAYSPLQLDTFENYNYHFHSTITASAVRISNVLFFLFNSCNIISILRICAQRFLLMLHKNIESSWDNHKLQALKSISQQNNKTYNHMISWILLHSCVSSIYILLHFPWFSKTQFFLCVFGFSTRNTKVNSTMLCMAIERIYYPNKNKSTQIYTLSSYFPRFFNKKHSIGLLPTAYPMKSYDSRIQLLFSIVNYQLYILLSNNVLKFTDREKYLIIFFKNEYHLKS